ERPALQGPPGLRSRLGSGEPLSPGSVLTRKFQFDLFRHGNRFPCMRMFFALSGSLLAATLSLPAFALERDVLAPNAPAATPGAPAAITAALDAQAEEPPQSRLDTLFSELKRERNERAAERIANRIQEEWNRSGSASIDLMMGWSRTAIENKKFDVALDFLDQVTTMKPDYAEGWNRRATVHFLMNNYAKS